MAVPCVERLSKTSSGDVTSHQEFLHEIIGCEFRYSICVEDNMWSFEEAFGVLLLSTARVSFKTNTIRTHGLIQCLNRKVLI